MKEKYETPVMEVVNLEGKDIITTSNGIDIGEDGLSLEW